MRAPRARQHQPRAAGHGPAERQVQRGQPAAGDDVRGSGADWLTAFEPDGRPRREFLDRLAAIREALTSDGRTLVQGALAWMLGAQPANDPDPWIQDGGAGRGERGRTRARAAPRGAHAGDRRAARSRARAAAEIQRSADGHQRAGDASKSSCSPPARDAPPGRPRPRTRRLPGRCSSARRPPGRRCRPRRRAPRPRCWRAMARRRAAAQALAAAAAHGGRVLIAVEAGAGGNVAQQALACVARRFSMDTGLSTDGRSRVRTGRRSCRPVRGVPVVPSFRVARWIGRIPPTPYGYHGGTTGAGPRAAAISAPRAMTRLSGRHQLGGINPAVRGPRLCGDESGALTWKPRAIAAALPRSGAGAGGECSTCRRRRDSGEYGRRVGLAESRRCERRRLGVGRERAARARPGRRRPQVERRLGAARHLASRPLRPPATPWESPSTAATATTPLGERAGRRDWVALLNGDGGDDVLTGPRYRRHPQRRDGNDVFIGRQRGRRSERRRGQRDSMWSNATAMTSTPVATVTT